MSERSERTIREGAPERSARTNGPVASERIGVLTFHRCINHGSYWQARCLLDGLCARGHRAELLDHHSRKVDVAEWRCALRPTLPTHVPRADHRPYRDKVEKFRKVFKERLK